jgi:glycosyltransferase involved in cell wall biosynthesis
MKIAIVTPYPPSKITLNEYAYHLINHLNDNEKVSEIVVITEDLDDNEAYEIEKHLHKVSLVPVWGFNKLSNLFTIKKAIRKAKADVVLYNIQFLSFGDNKIAAALGLLSPMLTKISGTPSTVLLHNIIETVDLEKAGISNNALLNKAYNFVGSMLTRIILQANVVALTIPKYVDIIKEKYKVDNVIHMPHGTFEIPEIPTYKKEIVERKQVMAFGKFGTYKKVEKMIEAVHIVRQRMNEDIGIVIAGTDNPNVKGYLNGVEEKYSSMESIRFTGYVEEKDVPTIFKESHVVVFPYTSTTGSSGVLHQAGSYGKAAVLPLLGDLKELVEEEGYAGAYFDPESKESLAEAIYSILTNDEKRMKIEKKNFEAASALSMEHIAERYVCCFTELLESEEVKRGFDLKLSA